MDKALVTDSWFDLYYNQASVTVNNNEACMNNRKISQRVDLKSSQRLQGFLQSCYKTFKIDKHTSI
jgi:hypothetical protein